MSAAQQKNASIANFAEAFLAGVFGLPQNGAEPRVVAADASYRSAVDDNTLRILYSLNAINGSAAFRRLASHMIVLRLNVNNVDTEDLQRGLQELSDILEQFVSGADRTPHSSRSSQDSHGHNNLAFVGFGPSFFRSRSNNTTRFDFKSKPANLDYLRLWGDHEAGIDPVQSQPDIIVTIESESRTVLLESYARIRRYAESATWLEFLDYNEGFKRGNGKNYLGFYDGIHNPSLESNPPVQDITLVKMPDEPEALESGSYMTFRKYRFDMDAWKAMGSAHQEDVMGVDKSSGADKSPFPHGSHAGNAVNAPKILRRGLNYANVQPSASLEKGLLFISFQKSPQTFETLHDNFLMVPAGKPGDRLLCSDAVNPLTADIYFVPDYLGHGYLGQQFFEPDKFIDLFRAARLARNGRFGEALKAYKVLSGKHPDFMFAWSNMSDLAPDLGLIDLCDSAADEALNTAPNAFFSLNVKAWAQYLLGNYPNATQFARRAVAAASVDTWRAYSYHSLGAALIEMGQYAEAETALQRSAARVNLEPLICYSLANSLDAQTRYSEAETLYNRTLEVIDYRLRFNQVSPRDRRNLFHMKYIRYNSPRNRELLARARQMLDEAPNLGRAPNT